MLKLPCLVGCHETLVLVVRISEPGNPHKNNQLLLERWPVHQGLVSELRWFQPQLQHTAMLRWFATTFFLGGFAEMAWQVSESEETTTKNDTWYNLV